MSEDVRRGIYSTKVLILFPHPLFWMLIFLPLFCIFFFIVSGRHRRLFFFFLMLRNLVQIGPFWPFLWLYRIYIYIFILRQSPYPSFSIDFLMILFVLFKSIKKQKFNWERERGNQGKGKREGNEERKDMNQGRGMGWPVYNI